MDPPLEEQDSIKNKKREVAQKSVQKPVGQGTRK
jgi:hypothetical protein